MLSYKLKMRNGLPPAGITKEFQLFSAYNQIVSAGGNLYRKTPGDVWRDGHGEPIIESHFKSLSDMGELVPFIEV